MDEYIKECVDFFKGFKKLEIENSKEVLWNYYENGAKLSISQETRDDLERELKKGKALACLEIDTDSNSVVYMEYFCWAPIIQEDRSEEEELYGRSDDVGCIRVYPKYYGGDFVDIADFTDWRASAYDAVDTFLRFERNMLGEFGDDGKYHIKRSDLEKTEFEFYLSKDKADSENWCGPHPVFFITGLMSERGMMR